MVADCNFADYSVTDDASMMTPFSPSRHSSHGPPHLRLFFFHLPTLAPVPPLLLNLTIRLLLRENRRLQLDGLFLRLKPGRLLYANRYWAPGPPYSHAFYSSPNA
jgi:hypothetical protein